VRKLYDSKEGRGFVGLVGEVVTTTVLITMEVEARGVEVITPDVLSLGARLT